jgi:hypothetical protein
MQLEQKLYKSYRDEQEETEKQRSYTLVDLDTLSASLLYSHSTPLRVRVGGGLSKPLDASNLSGGSILPDLPRGSSPLTIRDFPDSGFQLHIHEGPGGSANIKGYGEKKGHPISSYDAAMSDILADNLGIKRISHEPSVEERIKTINDIIKKYG